METMSDMNDYDSQHWKDGSGGADGAQPGPWLSREEIESRVEWQSWNDLVDQVSSGDSEAIVSTISVLEHFGRERRGAVVNQHIANWLEKFGLDMFPPIAEADYYGNVRIQKRPDPSTKVNGNKQTSAGLSEQAPAASGVNSWVLSTLKEDGEELDCLQYGDTVEDALKLMDERKRTKLPVFFSKTDRSTLIGTVTLDDLTFEKTSPSSKLIERANTHVPVVSTNEKLFDWIPAILTHGFVYGKNQKGEIVQIYTTFDVATHLNAITAMFLRANELEELLRESLSSVSANELDDAIGASRRLSDIPLDQEGNKTFSKEDISSNGSVDELQNRVETLTFADYMKCIAHPSIWEKSFAPAIGVGFQKEQCMHSLNDARLARNKVMHFNRSDALENLIPSFEALAVWLRKVVSHRRSTNS